MHVPGPEEEKKPECVIPRIRAMFGQGRDFALEWVSAHTFQCRRMQHFRHGRLLFVGDAAHQVSHFGAGGANSGLQDIDKLVWKLKLMLDGLAPHALLDTHTAERAAAADANILNSTRSTDFITPKIAVSKAFRNAALQLARGHAFARKLVNAGRLSCPLSSPIRRSTQPMRTCSMANWSRAPRRAPPATPEGAMRGPQPETQLP